ncbi:unnamed protein product [Pleuronectes platessa]|uniref:Uncharacterized protein n=1 Tax=Pleuronectes platessa TaxID=8262 RepID=A0A9N7VXZ6_PLEPL|nr:unnamed protein product [Pleuronectes platessa]
MLLLTHMKNPGYMAACTLMLHGKMSHDPERRCRKLTLPCVSAVMLLVGTQPLRAQHPPLTPLPLGSARLGSTRQFFPPVAGRKNKPDTSRWRRRKDTRSHTEMELS